MILHTSYGVRLVQIADMFGVVTGDLYFWFRDYPAALRAYGSAQEEARLRALLK